MATKHKYWQRHFPTEKTFYGLVTVLTNTALNLFAIMSYTNKELSLYFGGQWEFGKVTFSAWDPKLPLLLSWNKSSSLKLMKQCEVWGLRLLSGSAGSMQIKSNCLVWYNKPRLHLSFTYLVSSTEYGWINHHYFIYLHLLCFMNLTHMIMPESIPHRHILYSICAS